VRIGLGLEAAREELSGDKERAEYENEGEREKQKEIQMLLPGVRHDEVSGKIICNGSIRHQDHHLLDNLGINLLISLSEINLAHGRIASHFLHLGHCKRSLAPYYDQLSPPSAARYYAGG
jgi:hypothetical protein